MSRYELIRQVLDDLWREADKGRAFYYGVGLGISMMFVGSLAALLLAAITTQ